MRADLHPEYPAYLRDKDVYTRGRAALARWELSGKPFFIDEFALSWTPEGARAFTRRLSRLLQVYNQVLWEGFPYCPRCLGQCCGRNAATIEVFDLLALALLDLPLPALPERIEADSQDCIYHSSRGCAWPVDWRTQKCWLFYCVGSFEKDEIAGELASPVGTRYSALGRALCQATAGMLPEPLRVYERVSGVRFRDWLEKPLSFSRTLTQALLRIFLLEFNRLYLVVDPQSLRARVEAYEPETVESWISCSQDETALESIEAVIQEALERLPAGSPRLEGIAGQISDDLETLEWIVLGRPGNSATLLEDMRRRYSQPPQPVDPQVFSLWDRIRELTLLLKQGVQQEVEDVHQNRD